MNTQLVMRAMVWAGSCEVMNGNVDTVLDVIATSIWLVYCSTCAMWTSSYTFFTRRMLTSAGE